MDSSSKAETPFGYRASKQGDSAGKEKILKGKVGEVTDGPAHNMDEVMSSILDTPDEQARDSSYNYLSAGSSRSSTSDDTLGSRHAGKGLRQKLVASTLRMAHMADIGLRRAPMIIMIALPAAAAASCAYFGFALTEAILWVVLILMLIADRQRSTYHVHGLSGWDSGDGTVVDKTARMWQVVEYIERMENMMRHFEAADDMERGCPVHGPQATAFRSICNDIICGCVLGAILLPTIVVGIVALALALFCAFLRLLGRMGKHIESWVMAWK